MDFAGRRKCAMTCNEFEEMGLDAERDASLSDAQRTAATAHVASCPRCAALRDSWEAARVEMRLRQQFRTQYHAPKVRRTAVVAAWGLAAAAVLVGAMSWVKWSSNQQNKVAVKPDSPASNQVSSDQNATGDSQTLMADNELGDFTLLPGVLPAETDGSAILNVRMQRGALGALG